MIPFGQKIELHGFDFLRERRIQGSSMGSNHFRVDMPRLVEFYMRGKLHLEDWISAKLKLSEINEGFAAMKAGKTVRSVDHVRCVSDVNALRRLDAASCMAGFDAVSYSASYSSWQATRTSSPVHKRSGDGSPVSPG